MNLRPPGQIIPGALAKLGRSQRHLHELRGEIAQWQDSSGVYQEVQISQDRMSWALHLRVPKPPPLDDWALILGDAIHNARTSLDVAVFELSNGAALSSNAQRSLHFPIHTDSEQWENALKKLGAVPEPFRSRLHDVQPFIREGESHRDLLPVLHSFDILDKHRILLSTSVEPVSSTHDITVTLADHPWPEGTSPETTIHTPQLIDFARLMSGAAPHPIEKVVGRVELMFIIAIKAPDLGPIRLDILSEGFPGYVRQVLNYLCTGVVEPLKHFPVWAAENGPPQPG